MDLLSKVNKIYSISNGIERHMIIVEEVYTHSLLTFYTNRNFYVLSILGRESDYVVQYNFYDTTQLLLYGEVAQNGINTSEFIVHN